MQREETQMSLCVEILIEKPMPLPFYTTIMPFIQTNYTIIWQLALASLIVNHLPSKSTLGSLFPRVILFIKLVIGTHEIWSFFSVGLWLQVVPSIGWTVLAKDSRPG